MDSPPSGQHWCVPVHQRLVYDEDIFRCSWITKVLDLTAIALRAKAAMVKVYLSQTAGRCEVDRLVG